MTILVTRSMQANFCKPDYEPTLLGELLPADIIGVEHMGDPPEEPLHPEESHYVHDLYRRAGERARSRIREFSVARICARRALASLGVSGHPLLPGADRVPGWPDSVIGSITHTSDYCGVAVARRTHYSGIGIDAEKVASVKRELWPEVLTQEELDFLADQPAEEQQKLAAISFSAKEAFYKCQYCITNEFLGFKDVYVRIDGDHFFVNPASSIRIESICNAPFRGRYVIRQGLVLSAIHFGLTPMTDS